MVFHYSPITDAATYRACEVAYLGTRNSNLAMSETNEPPKLAIPITILVSLSNFRKMASLYRRLPNVHVKPLLFRHKDLNIRSMQALMAIDDTKVSPLYMKVVNQILRDIAINSKGDFDYARFKSEMKRQKLNQAQREMLNLRMNLLESFIGDDDSPTGMEAREGEITIVDLSCPFVDRDTACVLFSICMESYLGSSPHVRGKIVALDEAHKVILLMTKVLSNLFGISS